MVTFKVKGKTVMIDKEDEKRVLRYSWRLRWDGRLDCRTGGKMVLIHRYIMNPPIGVQVDHIDGNPLNNTRENLRFCSNRQNQQNSRKRSGCFSKYKGVTFRRGKYELSVNGKYIRAFENDVDAAMAYDVVANQLYGEFSRPNFPCISEKDKKRISNLLIFKKEGLSYFSSKYKGIGYHKSLKKWRARAKIGNSWKTLGYHNSEIEALKQLRNHNENCTK